LRVGTLIRSRWRYATLRRRGIVDAGAVSDSYCDEDTEESTG
jgi:hypothetical protein